MELKTQKKLASDVLKCSPSKVKLEESMLAEIKEAITKADIRVLVKQGLISKKPDNNTSRARARKVHAQKVKGQRKGHGSRKGTANARESTKRAWINKVRSQRGLIAELKDKGYVAKDTFRNLYKKVKGGFFRNKRHIKLYIGEHGLLVKKENK